MEPYFQDKWVKIYHGNAESFNGRTADFESVNSGSNPFSATNAEYSNGRKPVSEIGGEGSSPSSATR